MKSRTYKRKQKRRKQTRHRTKQRQSGGFLLQTDGFTHFITRLGLPADSKHEAIYSHPNFSRELHDYIVANSNITLLTDSSLYGYIYTAELKPDAPVYFSKLEFDSSRNADPFILQPVRKFIIKVVMIGFGEHPIEEEGKRRAKRTIAKEQLNEECDVQNVIYNKSATSGVSLTPALIHNTPLYIPRKSPQMILDSMTKRAHKEQLRNILAKPYAAITHVGYVFMEYADGFETLDNYIKGASKEDTFDALMLVNTYLIELALLGYEHGDIHYGNFMYNPNAFNTLYNDERGWLRGSAYILDFGRAYSITNEQIEQLRSAINDINSDKITETTYHTLHNVLKVHIDYNVLCEYIRRFYKGIEKRKSYMPVYKNRFYNLANVVVRPTLEPAGGAGAAAPRENAFVATLNNANEFVVGEYYDVYKHPEEDKPLAFIAKYRFIHANPTHLVFFIPYTNERVYIPVTDINTNYIFVRSTA